MSKYFTLVEVDGRPEGCARRPGCDGDGKIVVGHGQTDYCGCPRGAAQEASDKASAAEIQRSFAERAEARDRSEYARLKAKYE